MRLQYSYFRYWLDFLLAMTEKEIKARYKNAVLGFLWVFLNPLFQMLVIGFVFQFFVPVKVDNYFLFLFAGLLPWNFFSYSVTKTTPSIVYERTLIQKAKFPRESIVLSIILSNLFHLIASLGLFLIVLGIVNVSNFEPYRIWELLIKIPFLLFTLIWLLLVTVGVSLLFSALNVRFRDVNFIVQALMPLWFYATPLVYTLDLLPQKWSQLLYLNPLTGIIECIHFLLLGKVPFNFSLWGISAIISLFFLVAGIKVFVKESPYFDDWL